MHDPEFKPKFDPKQARELRDDLAQGRKPDSYKQCLENHGFTWHPFNRRNDGQVEAQWRHAGLRCSFTEDDLTTGFRSPEELDRWLRSWKLSRRMQGIAT